MICVALAGAVIALATDRFTLDWTHSVERTAWVEWWEAGPGGLRPVAAEIQGTGAGMELPMAATRTATGWRYSVDVPALPRLLLAASGETGRGWRLCGAGQCHELGSTAGAPITLWSDKSCG